MWMGVGDMDEDGEYGIFFEIERGEGVEKGYLLTMCMSLEKRRKIYLRNNYHFLEFLPSKAFSSS